MQFGSWELVDGVEHTTDVTSSGVGFDWQLNRDRDGVLDIELNDLASCLSLSVTAAVNKLVERHSVRVVRVWCWVQPQSEAEALSIAAILSRVAPYTSTTLLVETVPLPLFRNTAGRSAPLLPFGTPQEVEAATATWST